MRLAFFGSGAFGLPTLQALSAAHEIAGVVTQPDRPAGRGGKPTPTPIGDWVSAHLTAPLLKPERCNDASVVATIHAWHADAWVVIAFGQKLGRALLGDRFAINLHASLLPRWRGAAPLNAAILAGDTTTGNSIITLADRMDAGFVLGQSTRTIGPAQTTGKLHDELSADGPALVERVLADFLAGTLRREAQDESAVTIAPKMSKDDGWVDFTANAEACRRRVNGLAPWPGVTVRFRGEPLKLLRATDLALKVRGPAAPGTIIDPTLGTIACAGDTTLHMLDVQPPGRRAMPWPAFANGARVQPGEQLLGGKGQ